MVSADEQRELDRRADGTFGHKSFTVPEVEITAKQDVNDILCASFPGASRYKAAGVDAPYAFTGDLPPGVTLAEEEQFTVSDCAFLADEIHQRTGWPRVIVSDGPDGVAGWVHAGVLTPEGLILDVRGLHEPSDWVDQWAEGVDAFGADYPDEYDSENVWVYDIRDTYGADAQPFAHTPTNPTVYEDARRLADKLLAPRTLRS